MPDGLLLMSRKELDRLSVIQQVESKQLTQLEAAKQLGISSRTARRIQRKYQRFGPSGLISKRRAKVSNNKLSTELKARVINLLKTHYHDFGPTLAHEKLSEQHGLKLSVESTRQIMLAEGLWVGKKRKVVRHHQQRGRRSCLGELVQIDGSPHDWFEGRAEICCLIVFIDDATSRLLWLHFSAEENTEAYFTSVRACLKKYGRPLSYYSDRHGIFRVNAKEAVSGNGETQFSRAMRELGIELICANSPQAKGRVERANGILQDRLVKEMRLQGISSIAEANAFLPAFIENYNKRFAVAPSNEVDAHRASLPDEATLNLILSQQHQRTLSKNLEISYNNIIYQVQSNTPSYTMRGAKVIVCELHGSVKLLYKGKSLPYKTYEKNNRPVPVVSSKQLNRLKVRRSSTPKADHPWRNYPKPGLPISTTVT